MDPREPAAKARCAMHLVECEHGQVNHVDFWRIRLGIGHPGHRDRVTGHVLKDFAKQDKVWLDPLLDAIAESLPLLVAGEGEDAGADFMTKVALLAPPPAKESPAPKENQKPDPD